MKTLRCLFVIFITTQFILPTRARSYPNATVSTLWTNNNISIKHSSSNIRAILFREGDEFLNYVCAFLCIGDRVEFPFAHCDDFHFAVFIFSDYDYAPHVIWSANRDRPVKENATLELSTAGNLILKDADGTVVWSTNTLGKSVVGMHITETGNLVLVDNKEASVWASFDHPTDTWVLGQTLREGQRLTSNVSATNWTQGQYYLSILSNGLKAYADSNPPQLYYQTVQTGNEGTKSHNLEWSTFITFTNGSLDIFPSFVEHGFQLVSLPSSSSAQYMRLDSDGHLRHYAWSPSEYIWRTQDVDFQLEYCDYPTVCGEYGICSNGQCSCPDRDSTYFRHVDESQPNLGCLPLVPLSCQSIHDHAFLAVRDVSYFNYIDEGAVAIGGTNEENCKQVCLKNCSCKAAFFKYHEDENHGDCYLPSQVFSLKNNKPEVGAYNSSAFIKVQNSSTPSMFTPLAIFGITLGALFVACVIIGSSVVIARRKRVTVEEDAFDVVAGIPMRFSLEELKTATEDFHQKIGEGGFGSVFEGTLSDGVRVAVKRLDGIGQGKKEFLAEVETIGSIHHLNLVRLIGFCAEQSHRLLVYEYMCNGSLDKWIFHRNQDLVLNVFHRNLVLSWRIRLKIITDIAKGLSYLHEECRQKIAHFDIKPQNILLDERFNAKVSDFGLCKLIDRDQTSVMTRIRGTRGYLAPEWFTSKVTEKADVYSYGIVVMEIVCGRKNLDYSKPEESFHLLSLLQEKAETNELLDLVDNHNSDMESHVNEIIEMMKLAMWCLQSDHNRRPPMSVVVKVLEGSIKVNSDIEYRFNVPAPLLSHEANTSSTPQLASLLSGPR